MISKAGTPIADLVPHQAATVLVEHLDGPVADLVRATLGGMGLTGVITASGEERNQSLDALCHAAPIEELHEPHAALHHPPRHRMGDRSEDPEIERMAAEHVLATR